MIKYSYIVMFFLVLGCGEDNRCLKSLGDEISLQRTLTAEFTKLYVEDRIKVLLIQDSLQAGKLVLRGPENILSHIGFSVNDGELKLTNDNTCNFVRSFDYALEVDVYFKELTQLNIESIAEVRCKDSVLIDKLEVTHNALSDIDLLLKGREVFVRSRNTASSVLRGKLKVLKASVEEISDLDARQLVCEEVFIDTHTQLDCKMNATKGFFINIYNDGNIEQYGQASEYSIINDRTGSGNLIQK